ncbi:ATP-binding protein [Rhodoferax sp.]|uniref:ATP-binding protein n=1 Tax=Rhodoferax sp. TaxID=50421 RepID=UPI0028442DAE|nr:ATP-binding protein [Rhodoferax sp.]MDR3369631.1 ATP-binding protein [Rhodoferax sp.]
MKPIRYGLISKIALLVICIEVAAFGALGWFYIHKYSAAVDEHVSSRLHLVASMVANDELPVSVISRKSLIGDLVGAPYLGGMVVGGNGRVIVATDPDNLGRLAKSIPGVNAKWFSDAAPGENIVAGVNTLTSISRVSGGAGSSSIYYTVITISSTEMDAQKRSIAFWGEVGSVLFILLSSAGIVIVAQRLITRRVVTSLSVLKSVEEGALDARIPVTSDDELGELQHGINSMTEKLGALLVQQRQIANDLQNQKDLLQSVLEHAPIRVFWKDTELRYLGCNSLFARDSGLSRPGELIGKTDFDMSWHDQATLYQADDRAVMKTGTPKLDFEEPQTTPNGNTLWLSTSKVPLLGTDQQVIGILGIYADITQRKLAEEKINVLNRELERRVVMRTADLEAANKELEAFSYSVSHDLRAPLRHIDGFLGLLKERIGTTLDEKSIHYMDTISDAIRRMGTLIDDLLAFSRMGRSEIAAMNVDLGALVRQVIHDFEPETPGREIDWRIGELPVVVGDFAMLRIVLGNLIANALKFTQKRPHVEIEIGCLPDDNKEIVVFIRDNGVGFDMKYAHKLFGVFQRLHDANEFEGTGIGLANVRRIISRHGGRTWADGQVGGGATFYFSLPKAAAPGASSVIC